LDGAFGDDFAAGQLIDQVGSHASLNAPMPVRCRTHQDGAETVQLDLEGKVLKQGIAEDFGPFHKSSPR
jgi:hypothetical protein